jgi:hypothetical protein
LALLALAGAAGCASPMPPPGGPPDTAEPTILSVTPDSGAVNVLPRAVVFTFDEVIAERGTGPTGMAGSVLVSPVSGETSVAWSRDQLYVRTSKGFRPNAVYTVTLVPGLADLRGNVMKVGRTVVFSTGGDIPDTRVTGIAFDWVKGTPITKGYVEAIRRADSTVYLALTDSSGRFAMRHLPQGEYTLQAVSDANSNRRLEPREPWASTTVTLQDSVAAELLAFVHDTLGPRISAFALTDSQTVRLTFDQPLLPELVLAPELFAIVGTSADSLPVPIAAVYTSAAFDSVSRLRRQQRGDSAAAPDSSPPVRPITPAQPSAPRDTAPPRARPSKASPISDVVLSLSQSLAPGTRYVVRSVGVRGLLGAQRPSERVFLTPVKRDSTAADSTRRRAPARRPARPPT